MELVIRANVDIGPKSLPVGAGPFLNSVVPVRSTALWGSCGATGWLNNVRPSILAASLRFNSARREEREVGQW